MHRPTRPSSVPSSRPAPRVADPGSRGYALLGMILLLATTSLVVGAAVTVYQRDLDELLQTETDEELEEIGDAILDYFEDTGETPSSPADLRVEPGGVSGWAGPYLQPEFEDREAAGFTSITDAWGNAYLLGDVEDWQITIRSIGPDGVDDEGDDDDRIAAADLDEALWDLTNRELRTIQTAINAYNYYPTSPTYLPSGWSGAVVKLQNEGFLPPGNDNRTRFRYDGWNQLYVDDTDPITSVTSAGPPQD